MTQVTGYIFIAGDQILLKPETLKELVDVFNAHSDSILVPVYAGVYGSPKIFPESMKEELMALQGDKGGSSLIKKYKELVIELAIKDTNENWDMDSEEDYIRIKERFK
jgi:CTP:molybdopterin cytidylyltransferase MocA